MKECFFCYRKIIFLLDGKTSEFSIQILFRENDSALGEDGHPLMCVRA